MRIALLAPIWESVPPPAYGGIERVVSLLAEGLVAAGHAVTLFATGDSSTAASLVASVDRPLRALGINWPEALPYELAHGQACFERTGEFDLVHNHMGYLGVALARGRETPVVSTLHGPFDPHNLPWFARCGPHPFVSISNAQRLGGPALDYVATVYNGVDTDAFAVSPKAGYLLNLGRISPEKGTHLAIEAARTAGLPLLIAGKVDPVDRGYFAAAVEPRLDGEHVRFIGEVGGDAKARLLAGAVALLHPVQWPEPFGLVMAEALAAGTPVIAFGLGAIPEVVAHGRTGFIVSSVAEMVGAIGRLGAIDPAVCRAEAVARFGARTMVAGYEAAYRQVIARGGAGQRAGLAITA